VVTPALVKAAKIAAQRVAGAQSDASCTNFRHGLVDELQSTENKADTRANFPLTSPLEGVKTHSFFDSFRVSRLAESPGLKRVHCSAPAAQGGRGAATVNSKLLVEAKLESVKGKTESRGFDRFIRLAVSPESKQDRSSRAQARMSRSARI